jgi:hypothetical protein
MAGIDNSYASLSELFMQSDTRIANGGHNFFNDQDKMKNL